MSSFPQFFDSPMRAALAGKRPVQTPVWFMRQAGRSLPEYRRARQNTTMLEACTIPDLAAEITLQPVIRHDVDAAVFFSDIVVPLYLAGVDIDILPGRGPVLASPIRAVEDITRLTALEVEDWSVIETAAAQVRRELAFEKVLMGFAGAPFTLASYLIEADTTDKLQRRQCRQTKAFIEANPAAWNSLATWCARLSGLFMKAQIAGGAEAVQLFDSWAGSLTVEEYRRYALPYSNLAFQVAKGAAHVHFAAGAGHLLPAMGEIAEIVSVSNDVTLGAAAKQLGHKPLQGNLDPEVLLEGIDAAWKSAEEVLAAGRSAPSHIFNLGHGVLPQTDPGVLTELTARIHAWRA